MRKMFYNKKILQNAIFVVQNAKREKTDSKFLIFTKNDYPQRTIIFLAFPNVSITI